MPRRQIAIASAATWPSLQPRVATPRTKASICASSSAWPSRLARMISCARIDIAMVWRVQFTRWMRGALPLGATVPWALT